ncbi:hypothetical protein FS837_010612 [Tulasnella sp. UAMH 9824]|nr:hypothetical protein FS837_010612 [Tulasnella sp. UAMH 9824]
MAFLRALKDFACLPDPKTIPPSNLLKYTDTTITIFDKYPKANFHFLVLPRVRPDAGLTTTVLHDLKSLLAWKEKEKALEVLKDLEKESKEIQEMVRDEMHKRFGEGCEWKVFAGFHAVPSMHHVHLHVISSDYVSPSLKTKKHWNSFSPKLGFFLELKDVLEWFQLPDDAFKKRASLPESRYESLLKSDMQCWRCDTDLKTVPKLKEHLQTHLDRDIARMKKKRKHEIDLTGDDENEAGTSDRPPAAKMAKRPEGKSE